MIDLYDMPFNIVHELYYQAFTIREAREKERKEQEEAKRREEENAKKRRKSSYQPKVYNNRLSPAAQAQAINEKKFQDDESKRLSEGNNNEPGISSPISAGVDLEDLQEVLEEGI